MKKKEYKSNFTHQELKDKGFKYNRENQCYTYTFPVHKYNKKPIIMCQIYIYEDDNKVKFNVIDTNGNLYSGYYNREFGKNILTLKLNKVISNELKKLGFSNK